MKKLILLLITILAFWGCEKDPTGNNNNITELEGIWSGTDNYSDIIIRTFNFSGSDLNYTEVGHEDDEDNEWYVCTFTFNTSLEPKQIDMTIVDSFPDASEAIGLTALGIYEIDGNTLTLAGHEPGVSIRPSSFSGGGENGTRVFSLIKE